MNVSMNYQLQLPAGAGCGSAELKAKGGRGEEGVGGKGCGREKAVAVQGTHCPWAVGSSTGGQGSRQRLTPPAAAGSSRQRFVPPAAAGSTARASRHLPGAAGTRSAACTAQQGGGVGRVVAPTRPEGIECPACHITTMAKPAAPTRPGAAAGSGSNAQFAMVRHHGHVSTAPCLAATAPCPCPPTCSTSSEGSHWFSWLSPVGRASTRAQARLLLLLLDPGGGRLGGGSSSGEAPPRSPLLRSALAG